MNLETTAFYSFVVLIELAIFCFLAHFWYKANEKKELALQWRWTDEDSRNMWIDAAKTMITAAGIAAALIASLSVSSQPRPSDPIVIRSVKVATISLIVCVCASMPLILALSRGHETGKSRNIESQRPDLRYPIREGALSNFALGIILLSAFIALSGFFVGFLFLGRIVWHF